MVRPTAFARGQRAKRRAPISPLGGGLGVVSFAVNYVLRDHEGGTSMATKKSGAKPAITVEPRPDGKWAIQKDGGSRASTLGANKASLVARARAQAKREGVELVIKDAQGRIQSKDSHGRDPRRSKG